MYNIRFRSKQSDSDLGYECNSKTIRVNPTDIIQGFCNDLEVRQVSVMAVRRLPPTYLYGVQRTP